MAHKYSTVVEGYVEDSIESKAKICKRIDEIIRVPISPRPSTSKQKE